MSDRFALWRFWSRRKRSSMRMLVGGGVWCDDGFKNSFRWRRAAGRRLSVGSVSDRCISYPASTLHHTWNGAASLSLLARLGLSFFLWRKLGLGRDGNPYVQNLVRGSAGVHSIHNKLMDRDKQWITKGWHAMCLRSRLILQQLITAGINRRSSN